MVVCALLHHCVWRPSDFTLSGQLDEVQMELMKLDVGHVVNDQSEMLPDVLNAAQQQLARVQQLAELRENQVIKVNFQMFVVY